MSKREIGVKVIIEGATLGEALFIQYAISEAFSLVQEAFDVTFCEMEVNE